MIDLSNVNRAADGRLLARGFVVSTCKSCTSIHLDMEDASGRIFCTAFVEPDQLREFAAILIECANKIPAAGKVS